MGKPIAQFFNFVCIVKKKNAKNIRRKKSSRRKKEKKVRRRRISTSSRRIVQTNKIVNWFSVHNNPTIHKIAIKASTPLFENVLEKKKYPPHLQKIVSINTSNLSVVEFSLLLFKDLFDGINVKKNLKKRWRTSQYFFC